MVRIMSARRRLVSGAVLVVTAIVLGIGGAQYGGSLPDVPSTGPRNFANPTYSALIVTGILAWVSAWAVLYSGWRSLFGASSTLRMASTGLAVAPVALWGAMAVMSFVGGGFIFFAGALLLLALASLVVGVAAAAALVATPRRFDPVTSSSSSS